MPRFFDPVSCKFEFSPAFISLFSLNIELISHLVWSIRMLSTLFVSSGSYVCLLDSLWFDGFNVDKIRCSWIAESANKTSGEDNTTNVDQDQLMLALEELDNESDRNKEKIDENKDFVTKSENDLKVQRIRPKSTEITK